MRGFFKSQKFRKFTKASAGPSPASDPSPFREPPLTDPPPPVPPVSGPARWGSAVGAHVR